MLLKTKFFLKGVKLSVEAFMILLILAYDHQNRRLKEELDEVKSKKNQAPTAYYHKKHPKSGSVPEEKPENPIGFTGGLYMISYNELDKILDKLDMDKNLTSIEFRENDSEMDHIKELILLDRTCRAVITFSHSTSNQYQKETRMIYYRRKDAPRGYTLDLEEFLKDDRC